MLWAVLYSCLPLLPTCARSLVKCSVPKCSCPKGGLDMSIKILFPPVIEMLVMLLCCMWWDGCSSKWGILCFISRWYGSIVTVVFFIIEVLRKYFQIFLKIFLTSLQGVFHSAWSAMFFMWPEHGDHELVKMICNISSALAKSST